MKRQLIPDLDALSRLDVFGIVQVASQYEARVMVEHEDKIVNAKSMLGLLSLMNEKKTGVYLVCEGPDEEEAAQTLLQRIEELRTGMVG